MQDGTLRVSLTWEIGAAVTASWRKQGEVILESSVAITKKGLAQVFGSKPRSRIAFEVGTHSPWVSLHLTELGHEVVVAYASPGLHLCEPAS